MSENSFRFGFGKNWKRYVKKFFNEERLEIAKSDLLRFLKLPDMSGKYFLDIGCGSGLSSLVAISSGARKVFSFDYDIHAVEATRLLKHSVGDPDHWEVMQGSILDDVYVDSLEPADIVYAWGVLHHTGDVWHALENTKKLMKPGGLLFLALYEYNVQVNPPPEFWLDIKQKYNRGGWLTKRRMELWYIWGFICHQNLRSLPSVIRLIRSKKQRGMAFYTDLVDWLGGWPMEFVKLEEVQAWAAKNNLDIINLNYGNRANTEYLFTSSV